MDTELAWASGLFEGEGCFRLTNPHGKHAYYPEALLGSTDEDVVRRFHRVIGFGNVTGPYRVKTRPNVKPTYMWKASGFEKTQALAAMLWFGLGQRRRAKVAEVIRGAGDHFRARQSHAFQVYGRRWKDLSPAQKKEAARLRDKARPSSSKNAARNRKRQLQPETHG